MRASTLIWALISLWALLVSTCLRPTEARCPENYHLATGIRRDGSFVCWPSPVLPPGHEAMTPAQRYDYLMDNDGTFGHPELSVQPDGEIESRIYCTGGAQPIVRDHRTVGCQR